eukprot:3874301-Amphidinium_carterae.1
MLAEAEAKWGHHDVWSTCLVAPPMGDSKAPDVAQCVHSHLGWQAECLTESTAMAHGHEAPKGPLWIGCYVDDYAQVAVLDDALPSAWAAKTIQGQADIHHGRMLGAYERARIERKVAKATKDEPSGLVWGAYLDGPSRVVSADPRKRRILVLATLEVCKAHLVAPLVLHVIVGHWQHHLTFNRACMCVLEKTYTWLRSSYVGERVGTTKKWLSRCVRDELLSLCILAPLMSQHLDTPLSQQLVATDATIERGAVVIATLATPSQAAFLWLASDKPISKMTFVPQMSCVEEKQDLFALRLPQRANDALNAFVESSQFRAAASFSFRNKAHINRQELLAWLSGLRCVIRHRLASQQRIFCIIDSMVCEHVIRKGRSSSRQLNAVLQRALGLRLVHGLEPLPMWVPSATNPADDPTRGVKIRRATPMDASMMEQWRSAMQDAGWPTVVTKQQWQELGLDLPLEAKLSIRDQWWRMSYDQTYGYPGEGPLYPTPGRSADLRTRVQPLTEERYRVRLAHVNAWLHDQHLPSVGTLADQAAWHALDMALLAFVQHLHDVHAPISHGTWALAAV